MAYEIDYNRLPAHVAIIMDGNGRWAKAQGLPRTAGHVKGTDVAHQTIEDAARIGLKYLTLYTFSTENWNRPTEEVERLMELLFDNIEEETLMKNNLSFTVIGDMMRLPERVRTRLQECIDHTAANTGMRLCLALSYSSRWEMTLAMRDIAEEVKSGALNPGDITEETINAHLNTTRSLLPDPDLLIRTGGEQRISNFLLWQSAYTELYYTPTYWPDFTRATLEEAIADYQQRERRYGKTSEQIDNQK
ncbi:MAG: isoprenyl transferase [Bacteroidaceae bacterium]|nr:isoprenyl transferase [Bacteroidaceae bacterium]